MDAANSIAELLPTIDIAKVDCLMNVPPFGNNDNRIVAVEAAFVLFLMDTGARMESLKLGFTCA